MENNIFLIGFMGVGKSTIGKALAQELQTDLIEMDETIEKEQGISINDIFAQYGEKYFRDLESELVVRIGEGRNSVVSCGGGVVLRAENVENMKKSGKIVFLTATPETIYKRVCNSTNRPLLNGNMNVEYIAQLMEKRHTIYQECADIIVGTDEKVIEDIIHEILCTKIFG